MKVLKFGGSSVADDRSIEMILKIIEEKSKIEPLYIVVSAIGNTTDLLIRGAEEAAAGNTSYKEIHAQIEKTHIDRIKSKIPITDQSAVISKVKSDCNRLESLYEGVFLLSELTAKTKDLICSYGELLSAFILYQIAKSSGLDIILADSREFIVKSSTSSFAVDYTLTFKNIKEFQQFNTAQIALFPGFVAKTIAGEPATLGRGGSDYTAAILAAATRANEIEIWTDVSGMFTANPKLVKQAKSVSHISYREAMELSHFGAKVIYPPTIQPVLHQEIPIRIKNTFDPSHHGTLITKHAPSHRSVSGISHIEGIALLTLEGSGMVGIPGFSKRLFESLYQASINVILITQASSEHSICLAVNLADAEKAKQEIDTGFAYEISKKRIAPLQIEKEVAIVALVGDHMYHHQGLSGKMFSALGKNNVNIRAIAQGASERNISVVIAKKDIQKALNTLHEAFFEVENKVIHLFVTGVGNVGSKLIDQLKKQKKYLLDNLKLRVQVIGISNSKKMVFDREGIDLSNWDTVLLNQGKPANPDLFFETVKTLNLRNTVFVDNTANETISKFYKEYLKESISVVTCNKIACADAYKNYNTLQLLSQKYNASFLYETNVGAGLPIIDTLNNLIASGDRVHKIQAVLSGSLNFIFNNYTEGVTFYDIVKRAKSEGYTEPNPKIDLSGVDVARKILILARECGLQLELDQVQNNSFLPNESLETQTAIDFFESLKQHENHFKSLLGKATNQDCRLKYVAELDQGIAKVGLQYISKSHPFYKLEGSDNIVVLYTDRYPVHPLIIKGAGAGAAVTASGIFADIIRIGKKL